MFMTKVLALVCMVAVVKVTLAKAAVNSGPDVSEYWQTRGGHREPCCYEKEFSTKVDIIIKSKILNTTFRTHGKMAVNFRLGYLAFCFKFGNSKVRTVQDFNRGMMYLVYGDMCLFQGRVNFPPKPRCVLCNPIVSQHVNITRAGTKSYGAKPENFDITSFTGNMNVLMKKMEMHLEVLNNRNGSILPTRAAIKSKDCCLKIHFVNTVLKAPSRMFQVPSTCKQQSLSSMVGNREQSVSDEDLKLINAVVKSSMIPTL